MEQQNLIRVLIVDDHKVVRKGLKAFLMAYDNLCIVGEAGSGEEAVSLCMENQPDVVLMDLVMPGIGGVAATRTIAATCSATHVIVLTSFEEEDFVEEALKAGATGYLLKNADADELFNAIQSVHRGKTVLAPEAAEALIRVTQRVSIPDYALTEREAQVLALLVEGLTNPEIAQRLSVKPSTIKFHLKNAFSKLGVTTRTEAVALALQQKLVVSLGSKSD